MHYTRADKEIYSKFCLLKARALNNLNNPKEGLNILYPLLNEAEKQEDTLIGINAINGIAGSYVSVGQDKEAQDWCYKALHLFPVAYGLIYAEAASVALNNLSLTYLHLYEDGGTKSFLDSAEHYTTAAIEFNKVYGILSAYSFGLKGTILGYAGKAEQGEVLLKESLRIYRQIGNEFYVINTMSVMGNFYTATHQPEKGIAICKEGIALSQKREPNFFLYQNLADNYKLAGNYIEYGETLNKLLALKDSMYKKNSAESLSEMQTKYEVQKKENTIIQQKFDLAKKNDLIFGSLILLAATIAVGFFIFQNRKKNQQLKMQEMVIDQKKKTTPGCHAG